MAIRTDSWLMILRCMQGKDYYIPWIQCISDGELLEFFVRSKNWEHNLKIDGWVYIGPRTTRDDL